MMFEINFDSTPCCSKYQGYEFSRLRFA